MAGEGGSGGRRPGSRCPVTLELEPSRDVEGPQDSWDPAHDATGLLSVRRKASVQDKQSRCPKNGDGNIHTAVLARLQCSRIGLTSQGVWRLGYGEQGLTCLVVQNRCKKEAKRFDIQPQSQRQRIHGSPAVKNSALPIGICPFHILASRRGCRRDRSIRRGWTVLRSLGGMVGNFCLLHSASQRTV